MTDRPLARRTDPSTSHEAAQQIRPQLGEIQARVLALISMFPDCTATELASKAHQPDPRVYNRRVSELIDKGRIAVSGKRRCQVTGRSARTYRVPSPPTTQKTLF